MHKQPSYGTTAKTLHWVMLGLLLLQFPLGWLMPDVHRGMLPGAAMMWHVTIGMSILLVVVLRLAWRLSNPVAPEASLRPWQRISSGGVHWLLYGLVIATALSGWYFDSMSGWSSSFVFPFELPMLTVVKSPLAHAIGGWHHLAGWALLAAIGLHTAAAFA